MKIALFLVIISVLSKQVFSLDVSYGSSPVIDGTISAGEWNDAASFVFYGYNNVTITCYIKHNGLDTLFIAQDVPEMIGGDHGYIWLDLLNDGSTAPQTDDYWLSRYYFMGWPTLESRGTGSAWGSWSGPSGWNAEHTGDGWSYDHGQMEFAISYNKLGLVPGTPKTIGFMIGFGDDPSETDCWFWPSNGIYNNPDTWGEITSPDNWGTGTYIENDIAEQNNENIKCSNCPNPFSNGTTISCRIPSDGYSVLKIYDLSGQLVRDLHDNYSQSIPAGIYEVHWDGKDGSNRPLPGGVYLCHLLSGNSSAVCKIVLVE